MNDVQDILVKLVLPIVGIVIILYLVLKSYIKAPPNKAYIISGIRKKTIIGKSSLVIPIIERVDELYLGLIPVDVKNQDTPTNEFVTVDIDAVVQLEVNKNPEAMELAMKNFLNLGPDDISMKVQEILEGNMREITGQMPLKEMIRDRKGFGEKVEENASPDMAQMGLNIVSFNVQSFKDNNGVIEDLGVENIEQIRKDAAITRSEATRDIEIAKAENDNKAHEAKILSSRNMAEREKDLNVRQAELKIETDEANAKAAKVGEIEIENQELLLSRRKIDREKFEAEEAILIEKNRLAASIINKADADKYAHMAELDVIKQKELNKIEVDEREGQIIAKNIQAKLLAEAEGIRKKAEAMKEYGEAAKLEMIVNMLPLVSEKIAEPLKNIESITMYGEGNIPKLTEDITRTLKQVTDGVMDATGIDLSETLNNFLNKKDKVDNDIEDSSINSVIENLKEEFKENPDEFIDEIIEEFKDEDDI